MRLQPLGWSLFVFAVGASASACVNETRSGAASATHASAAGQVAAPPGIVGFAGMGAPRAAASTAAGGPASAPSAPRQPSMNAAGAPGASNMMATQPAAPSTAPQAPAQPQMPAQSSAAGAGAGAAAPPAGTPPKPGGPEDGDPAMPIVALSELPCGGPQGGFGLGQPNFKLDERDMIVTYPCDKHAGAPASFILNLHGTTPVEQHFYQHGYFAAHQFADSHNLIVVTPSSVVEQWGNMDNGEDEPHLMKIIDWVYASLNGPGKFDIRAMWVGGHSWGGGYTARFGCKPELADRVKGLIMMSGGGVGGFGGAACADKVSVIISTAEGDGRMPTDQATVASGHGCAMAQTEMILQNVHTFWPMCQPGFVHANYYMLGKEHATFMDMDVVASIVDWVKLQRQ